MEAIRDTGGQLAVIYDPNDSIGIIDSYFPNCYVYNQWFKFHKAIQQIPLDYFVICSPNNHHMFHIEYGLSMADNVICEKPLVIDPAELESLEETIDISYSYPHKVKTVYPVLQLRDLHPGRELGKDNIVDVTYHTPRGFWYSQSWKFNPAQSGGLLMNIGIHLFDFLIYKFGPAFEYELDYMNGFSAAGYLKLARAKVKWNISIDPDNEPRREFVVNDNLWKFGNDQFKNAHTLVYQNILNGNGHDYLTTLAAIKLVANMNEKAKGRLWADYDHMQMKGWKT
jgi:UDP-N-acetyl-2-amino-2-deoxyglucuronate dehydrogenase